MSVGKVFCTLLGIAVFSLSGLGNDTLLLCVNCKLKALWFSLFVLWDFPVYRHVVGGPKVLFPYEFISLKSISFFQEVNLEITSKSLLWIFNCSVSFKKSLCPMPSFCLYLKLLIFFERATFSPGLNCGFYLYVFWGE